MGSQVELQARRRPPSWAPRGRAQPAAAILSLQGQAGNERVSELLGTGRSPALGVREMIALQRSAGNHAVGEMLVATQRQGQAAPPAVAPPLTTDQVARARSFYVRQPGKYTPEILRQIQARVGSPETGEADDDMISAVAAFQAANPPLKVDGMAGPRTLPTAFKVGLRDQPEVDRYVAGAESVIADWTKLTPEERAAKLVEAVNKDLQGDGVPQVAHEFAPIRNLGEFRFATWTLQLGRDAFAQAAPSAAERSDAAATVYHESRHAQQWFMMARMLAGKRHKAAGIAAEMQIPRRIADAAVADPLPKGSMEALEAEGWWDSVFGAGSAHRDSLLTQLDQRERAQSAAQRALDKAKEEDEKHHAPATEAKVDAAQRRLDAANEAFNKVRGAVLDLPEEFDATRAEEAVAQGLLKARP